MRYEVTYRAMRQNVPIFRLTFEITASSEKEAMELGRKEVEKFGADFSFSPDDELLPDGSDWYEQEPPLPPVVVEKITPLRVQINPLSTYGDMAIVDGNYEDFRSGESIPQSRLNIKDGEVSPFGTYIDLLSGDSVVAVLMDDGGTVNYFGNLDLDYDEEV